MIPALPTADMHALFVMEMNRMLGLTDPGGHAADVARTTAQQQAQYSFIVTGMIIHRHRYAMEAYLQYHTCVAILVGFHPKP